MGVSTKTRNFGRKCCKLLKLRTEHGVQNEIWYDFKHLLYIDFIVFNCRILLKLLMIGVCLTPRNCEILQSRLCEFDPRVQDTVYLQNDKVDFDLFGLGFIWNEFMIV